MSRGGYFSNEIVNAGDYEWACSGQYLLVDQGHVEFLVLEVYPANCVAEAGRSMQSITDCLDEDILADIYCTLSDRMADEVQERFLAEGVGA